MVHNIWYVLDICICGDEWTVTADFEEVCTDWCSSTSCFEAFPFLCFCVQMAPMHVTNAREVPEYEIDPKELDFTNSVDITKVIHCSWLFRMLVSL